jgi:hypothetical protein
MSIENCGCEDILNNNCAESPIDIETVVCSSNEKCLSTNWTKCILYDGVTLGCSSTIGSVNGFTFTGTAGDTGVYTTTGLATTGGTGTGATFNVTGNALDTTYAVVVNNAGTGYKVGDVLTIAGTLIQGSFTSPANDVTITITTLSNTSVVTSPLITKNQTLSTILANLNARICTLTPEGLDYSGFNYSCLRVGGNLESVGTVITTAQQFTESTASALCSLNTRLKVLETPTVTAGCITSLTGGETLLEVLNAIITEVCEVKTFLDLPITTTANCFTTVPNSSVDLSAWLQWIVDNTCTIKSTLEASITAQTTRINNINTYLHGTDNPAYPITYDTSCYGGSATANVHTTLTSLIAEVCSINTSLGGVPDLGAIVLDWATCFSGAPYTYSSAAQTLQTQLERILNVISREKITFSGDFTVTPSACGKSVSLAVSSSFSCSLLASCSISNLADVDITGVTLGKTLSWDGTKFITITPDTFNNIGVVNQAGAYAAAPLGFYHQAVDPSSYPKVYNTGFVEKQWAQVTNLAADYSSIIPGVVMYVKKTWDGHLLFKGLVQTVSVPVNSGINIPGGVTVGTLPAGYFPSSIVNIETVVVYISNTPSNESIILPCTITISTAGLMTMRCNPSETSATTLLTHIADVAQLDNPNYEHQIIFNGKAIYQ